MTSAKFIVLWVLVVSCLVQAMSCDGGDRGAPANRIFNGNMSSPGEFPFMVSVQEFLGPFGWWPLCGGSIIDEQHVLTAAHCVTDNITNAVIKPELMRVKVGCHELSKCDAAYRVIKVMVHHEWDHRNGNILLGNDIAVLKIADKIDFGSSNKLNAVGPVNLAPSDDSCCDHGKTQLTAIGWGLVNVTHSTDVLMKVNIDSYPLEKCKKDWGIPDGITDLVCTKTFEKDVCQGDSGGPLLRKMGSGAPVQVGIVSFGDFCVSGATKPGVFTKVSAFQYWIKQCTTNGSCPTL